MKIFLDSAQIKEVKEASNWGIIDGLTTNPTLIKKTGKKLSVEDIKELVNYINGPVSVEVIREDYNGMIDYKLEEVKGDVAYEGIKWATPDIKSLRKLMRYGYENPDWIEEIGTHNKKFIQDFTWDKSAAKAMEFLKE